MCRIALNRSSFPVSPFAGLLLQPTRTIVIQYGLSINQKDVRTRAIVSIEYRKPIACVFQGEKKPRRAGLENSGASV
jgi:hypothetical protein